MKCENCGSEAPFGKRYIGPDTTHSRESFICLCTECYQKMLKGKLKMINPKDERGEI